MTTATATSTWAHTPLGKVARITLGLAGIVMAALVMTTAAIVDSGSWALVVLGASLAAASARAAASPRLERLGLMLAIVIAIPLTQLAF